MSSPSSTSAPTNHTIDDTSPLVQYNNTANDLSGVFVSCPSEEQILPFKDNTCRISGQASNVFDFSKLQNGTMTVFWGTITVPFSGHSVYVYFANQDDVKCEILLDNVKVGDYIRFGGASGAASRSIMGYSNTTLNDGPHELKVTNINNDRQDTSVINFDGIEFTTGGAVSVSSAPQSSSSTGTISSPSASITPPSASTKSSPPIGAIVGATVGCILLLLFLLFLLLFLRKRRRRASFFSSPAAAEIPTNSPPPAMDDWHNTTTTISPFTPRI
ncbi:hypothetical protein R3P38DRAFT_374644 [Favolaschia claudopus]|uniref:Uncharacterized protein n=1 Tax=Favolaschia claudopus TaxID=2862362 RepID=A0AAV9ZJ33_9AGAR